MRIPIVRIGNSKGIRIPQAFLRQCDFGQEAELELEGRRITLKPVKTWRAEMCRHFDRIPEMDDKDVQNILRQIEPVECAAALLDAPEDTKTKIFNNMSERAGEFMRGVIERLDSMDARQLVIELARSRFGCSVPDQ